MYVESFVASESYIKSDYESSLKQLGVIAKASYGIKKTYSPNEDI